MQHIKKAITCQTMSASNGNILQLERIGYRDGWDTKPFGQSGEENNLSFFKSNPTCSAHDQSAHEFL